MQYKLFILAISLAMLTAHLYGGFRRSVGQDVAFGRLPHTILVQQLGCRMLCHHGFSLNVHVGLLDVLKMDICRNATPVLCPIPQ